MRTLSIINRKGIEVKLEKSYDINKVNINTLQAEMNECKLKDKQKRKENDKILGYVIYLEDS